MAQLLADDRWDGVHDLRADLCGHHPDPHAAGRGRLLHGCAGQPVDLLIMRVWRGNVCGDWCAVVHLLAAGGPQT